MSENKWETQPRLENGEFTFRGKLDRLKRTLQTIERTTPKSSITRTSKGGSYGELRKETAGKKDVEIHHMPANSASNLTRWSGPCIILEKEDHILTASYGRSKDSQNYRQKQRELISEGQFLDAEIMDIKDILKKTKAKYVKALLQKLDYDEKLYKERKING